MLRVTRPSGEPDGAKPIARQARWAPWPADLFVLTAAMPAVAQRVAPGRPTTLIVGRPSAPSAGERVDGARRGFSQAPLPRGALQVAWRRTVAPSIEHAPLVTDDGGILIFTPEGICWSSTGTARSSGGSPSASAPSARARSSRTAPSSPRPRRGDAVGVRLGAVRFRTRTGDRGAATGVAPLPLDDGGVIVASGVGPAGALGAEIAALDRDGHVRSRATLPAPVAWPLVATGAGVACVTAEGFVFLWMPGQSPTLAGSFGGPPDGGVGALDPHTLVAVVDGQRLVAMDLDRADVRVLSTSTAGALLGPPSIRAREVHVIEVTPGSSRLLAVDLAPAGVVTPFGISTAPAALDPLGRSGRARGPACAHLHAGGRRGDGRVRRSRRTCGRRVHNRHDRSGRCHLRTRRADRAADGLRRRRAPPRPRDPPPGSRGSSRPGRALSWSPARRASSS